MLHQYRTPEMILHSAFLSVENHRSSKSDFSGSEFSELGSDFLEKSYTSEFHWPYLDDSKSRLIHRFLEDHRDHLRLGIFPK